MVMPLPPDVFFANGRWMKGTRSPGGGYSGVYIPTPPGYNDDGTPIPDPTPPPGSTPPPGTGGPAQRLTYPLPPGIHWDGRHWRNDNGALAPTPQGWTDNGWTLDAAGYWVDQYGKRAGNLPPDYDPTRSPQTPMPDPAAGGWGDSWQEKRPGWQTWRRLDETTRDYYQQQPEVAWTQFATDTAKAGGTNFSWNGTPFTIHENQAVNPREQAFYNSKFGQAWANYTRRAEQDDGLLFTDTLTNDQLRAYRDEFTRLSAEQRGEPNFYNPTGRRL